MKSISTFNLATAMFSFITLLQRLICASVRWTIFWRRWTILAHLIFTVVVCCAFTTYMMSRNIKLLRTRSITLCNLEN